MYHRLTIQQEAIKAQMLEKKHRDDLMMKLMCEGTPEAIAQLEQMQKEDDDEHQQRQAQIAAEVQLQKEAQKKQAQATIDAINAIKDGKVLKRIGDYRQLFFYKKSKVIFDLTFLFADRYITDYHDRTKDQMIQAARSGKQNFVEGLQDGQANIEQALYLVSIGQGSLQELREDYEDYIRNHPVALWTKEHPRYAAMVEFCRNNNEVEQYQPFMQRMNDEEMANMALTLIHQTDTLIEGFLRKLEKIFLEEGGAKERMQTIRGLSKINRF